MAKSNETPGYEIPDNMRSMAETSVAQARNAFDEFMKAAETAMGTMENSTKAVQSGAMEINRKAMSFAEANVEATFEFAQRLVRARDVQEIVSLQQEFMRVQMDRLGQQTRELGERAGAVGQKMTRS